jgi:hypothetical protein
MRLLRDRARRRERGNVLVIGGEAGAGKSWVLDRELTAVDFPDVKTSWADPLPVLRLDAPSPGRMKALLVKMLSQVAGYEASDRPSEPMLMRQFVKVAQARGVRVVKIDEFQHIVNLARTDRHERTVSETLKTLLNETDIQLVLAGEPSVMTFFDRWKQFERRGAKLPMTPFAGEVAREEFADFLNHYDDQLVALHFRARSGFAEKVDRFRLATDGYVGLASKLIHLAAEMSFKAGHNCVDDTLAVAYERWRRRGDGANPFLMKPDAVCRALRRPATPAGGDLTPPARDRRRPGAELWQVGPSRRPACRCTWRRAAASRPTPCSNASRGGTGPGARRRSRPPTAWTGGRSWRGATRTGSPRWPASTPAPCGPPPSWSRGATVRLGDEVVARADWSPPGPATLPRLRGRGRGTARRAAPPCVPQGLVGRPLPPALPPARGPTSPRRRRGTPACRIPPSRPARPASPARPTSSGDSASWSGAGSRCSTRCRWPPPSPSLSASARCASTDAARGATPGWWTPARCCPPAWRRSTAAPRRSAPSSTAWWRRPGRTATS